MQHQMDYRATSSDQGVMTHAQEGVPATDDTRQQEHPMQARGMNGEAQEDGFDPWTKHSMANLLLWWGKEPGVPKDPI